MSSVHILVTNICNRRKKESFILLIFVTRSIYQCWWAAWSNDRNKI